MLTLAGTFGELASGFPLALAQAPFPGGLKMESYMAGLGKVGVIFPAAQAGALLC